MSLSINLGKLATGFSFPRLPQITLRIPNPFHQAPSSASTSEPSSLQQRLQEYLENRTTEESFFIDNGLLKAVPKKKVSHQRVRKRQLAPGAKQIKYLHNLNRCPSCGHVKRSHTLCMHCVTQIKNIWKADLRESTKPTLIEQELDEADRKLLYPGKKELPDEKILKKKDYVLRRTRTLPLKRNE